MNKPLCGRTDLSSKFLSVTKDKIVSRSEVVREAFNKLVREGVSESTLMDYLRLIPILPNRLPPLILGKTDKTTKNFPHRIERLAKEIESINSNSSLLYFLCLMERSEEDANSAAGVRPAKVDQAWQMKATYRQTLKDFRKLPRLLRAYAAYIELATRQREPRDNLQKSAVVQLLEMVCRDTGEFYFVDVGYLCYAAFDVADCPAPHYLENLDKLYRNNPRLHAPPIES